MEEYLKDKRFSNDTRHAQIQKHVLTATRNFDNRAKAFLKHIIMAKENPMNTSLFNYRIEFQARGAAHIHGVLWIDFDAQLPIHIDNQLIKAAFNKFRHDDTLSSGEEDEVVKFIDIFVTCSSDPSEVEALVLRSCTNPRAIAERAVEIATTVNQHKHNGTCKKYRTSCRFHFPKIPSIRTIITNKP